MNIFKRIAKLVKAVVWDGEIFGKSIDDIKCMLSECGQHDIEVSENVNELLIHECTDGGIVRSTVRKDDVVYLCDKGRICVMPKVDFDCEYEYETCEYGEPPIETHIEVVCKEPTPERRISTIESVAVALAEIDLEKEGVHLFTVRGASEPVGDSTPVYIPSEPVGDSTPVYIQKIKLSNITATFKNLEMGLYLIAVFCLKDNPEIDKARVSFIVEKK